VRGKEQSISHLRISSCAVYVPAVPPPQRTSMGPHWKLGIYVGYETSYSELIIGVYGWTKRAHSPSHVHAHASQKKTASKLPWGGSAPPRNIRHGQRQLAHRPSISPTWVPTQAKRTGPQQQQEPVRTETLARTSVCWIVCHPIYVLRSWAVQRKHTLHPRARNAWECVSCINTGLGEGLWADRGGRPSVDPLWWATSST
jgi:hypothetical protein